MKLISLILIFIMLLNGCSDNSTGAKPGTPESTPVTPIINYTVTQYFPHDTSLFTEGFLFHNEQLFESTGSPDDLPHTRSLIGISNLNTG